MPLDLQRELLLLVPFHWHGRRIALQRDGEISKRTGAEGTYTRGSGSEVRHITTATAVAVAVAIAIAIAIAITTITTRPITRPTTSPSDPRKPPFRTNAR